MNSDDERDENNIPDWKGCPGSVILINVLDSSRNTAANAHAATCEMLKQYLRISSAHNIAVCLYGIEDTQTSALGAKSVVEVFPLTSGTLDNFQKLRNINLSQYKPAKDFQLSDVLWHCSKLFTNCKRQLSSRSVIMLTRLDTPPVPSDHKPTLKRVVDLVDSNIEIRVINVAEGDYKIDPFYEQFLKEVNKGRDYVLPAPVWNVTEIEKVMHQQTHRHLAVSHLNFEIGNGMSIGVGLYNLLIKSPLYQQKRVNLERETNAIVSSVTKTMKVTTDNEDILAMDVDEEESGPRQVPLLKSEILFYQEYGGEKVEFTDAEMKKLRNPFGPPMMKLLGFKPARVMSKERWFLKSGYFLFPNEGLVEGSTLTFNAMHKALVETGTVGICCLGTRLNCKPTIVALSPCKHPLGLNIETGFDVIQIPFVENVRDIPAIDDVEESNVTEEKKILMGDVIKKLHIDYKPDMFENPKLQSTYKAIEAIALEEEDVQPYVDTTIPNPEKFAGVKEDLFEELFGPFEQAAPKRSTSSKDSGASSKKAKGEEIDTSLLQERIQCETVHQYTVAQLKEILKNTGNSDIPALTGLKKNELVDLVYQFCS
ncbi:X-ray repair cross-complementing protein 5-like [Pectinophora gossypiella]|uniref:X-ray repair cross-complementing protein 5-like n=1 Tax=Pectinophora gossypiella TaxID=13191 RepID=UPI00214E515E|nr:X-ray repair cross-complementing protein 5-like [Pectinophora gossypiella]